MDSKKLKEIAELMVAEKKGLLAMDESTPTCNKRFAKLGIPQTEEARRTYRELILKTPNLSKFISGTILYDETIRQSTKEGVPFTQVIKDAGMLPGIKVDLGAKDLAGFPGEKITDGLDNLSERLLEYSKLGACFAKWRAVITIGENIPSRGCIVANMHALARYAALCQQAGLVPIVEPEVIMDGNHTLEKCFKASEQAQRCLFNELYMQRVNLEGIILKPNMVLAGKECPNQGTLEQIADMTVQCLLRTVPAAVPGVAFLSGGQSAEDATMRLNAMNQKYKHKMPWRLTFSFSRAIQAPALELWHGKEENVESAQKVLYHRAMCNSAASNGTYTKDME